MTSQDSNASMAPASQGKPASDPAKTFFIAIPNGFQFKAFEFKYASNFKDSAARPLIFSGQPALPVNQEAARRETAAFSKSDATFKQPRHRHCEPTGRANARRGRHCERSEAIHLTAQRKNGLLRRYAPRNDDALSWI
jgi:hypothetical protein